MIEIQPGRRITMTDRGNNYMSFAQAAEFHGHECPGLAIGYRMSVAALEYLTSIRAKDEELVAEVENDACGVDALQCLTGCTFGKGNLIFHDYGKQVYRLYARSSGQGVRVLYHGSGVPPSIRRANRKEYISWILAVPLGEIISVEGITAAAPPPAQRLESRNCSFCGESVMVSRLLSAEAGEVCFPCFMQAQASKKTKNSFVS